MSELPAADWPTRRMMMGGIAGGTVAFCMFPKWHSVKYNYDYTVTQQMNYQYVKLRRNCLMTFGGAVIGSALGVATRNRIFD